MAQISWNHWHVRIAIILKIPTLHFSKHCTNPTQLPLWLICFQEKSLFAAWKFQWRACQRQKSRSFFGKYTRYVQTISCCSTHPFDKWNWHISGDPSVLSVLLPSLFQPLRVTDNWYWQWPSFFQKVNLYQNPFNFENLHPKCDLMIWSTSSSTSITDSPWCHASYSSA